MDTRPSFGQWMAATIVGIGIVVAGCADDDLESADGCFADPGLTEVDAGDPDGSDEPLTLVTHDSFLVSDGTLERFTAETGIEVEQVAAGDAGALVSRAILTKDSPTADVLFGIDNTFLCRGLEAGIFLPYRAAGLDRVDDSLVLDPHHRVTPIDYGDVCVNYWVDELPGPEPTSLQDLTDPTYADEFVTPNPETSSPGFAFLLATIAEFGDDWEQYWSDLVANGVVVTAGWNDAYYGDFIAGGGDRSLVTSYASSPPAEVIFADPPVDTPPTDVLRSSCFRQIEFAGILAGTERPAAAARLVEFMLGEQFQADIPLNMFVYPANSGVELPAEFVEFGSLTDDPLTLDPAAIEANRDEWTQRWTEIVVG